MWDKKSTKSTLYARFNGKCAYCSTPLTEEESTIDHWMPTALGGSSHISNLRLSCAPCNRVKSDLHPFDWIKVRLKSGLSNV